MHEIGHALGLEHPHENNLLSSDLDNNNYTIMSYTDYEKSLYPEAGYINGDYVWMSYYIRPETPMILDIAAIQEIYGANYSFNDGNTTYTIDNSKPFFKTLWDGGGRDTIDASGFETTCTINLNEGEYSSFYFAPASDTGGATPTYDGTNALGIALNCIIENATTGSSNDKILGNNVGNILKGMNGNDRILGGAGNDKLYGGSGNDRSYGQAGNDSLYMDAGNDTLDGGSGTDWLYVTGSANSVVNLATTTGQNTGYGTDIIKSIEHASGGKGVDKFYGTTGNNTLKGNNGNDILQGKNGNDNLQGGNNNDKLYGGNNNDKLYGGNGNDKSYGQAGNDSLYMDAGNDTLDGGTGTDWLYVTGSTNSVVNRMRRLCPIDLAATVNF